MMCIEITIGHQMFHMINMLSYSTRSCEELPLLQGPGSNRRGGLKEALRSTTTSNGISIVCHDGFAWGGAPCQKMMPVVAMATNSHRSSPVAFRRSISFAPRGRSEKNGRIRS